MKTLLVLLSFLVAATLSAATVYRGENFKNETPSSIATALGTVTAQEVIVSTDPDEKTATVTVTGITSQEQTDLDSLMVTTNGLTKE